MKYRSQIDGLRALAVVPVIFYHAGFELFSGGYVGVDVFFVISGYLITTILVNDIENDKFSIVNFYERRARRILPALFFVMLLCMPFAWMWLFPNQLNEFSRSLIAVSFFISNIFFFRESDYFSAGAEEIPLLHTWSLAVEEQYYVLFPIFLVFAWRFGRNRVFWTIVILAALSLIFSEIGWRKKPVANFYLSPTRAWELFAGSIAAFLIQKYGVRTNNSLASIGLVAVLLAIFVYDKSTPFPSLYALVPIIGSVLIVMYGGKSTLTAKILSNKILVGIGLISYSAYLWHQPLFAFAKLRNHGHLDLKLAIFLIIIVFFGAFLTWRYIETPIRKKTILKSRRSVFVFSVLGIIGFSLIGLYGHYKSPWDAKRSPKFLSAYEKTSDYIADNYFLIGQSWSLQREITSVEKYKVDNVPADRELLFDLSDKRIKTLIAGNSHSVDFFNVLSFSEKARSNLQVARFGIQISRIGEEFFNSPNYRNSDVVIFCSMFGGDDINHFERIANKVLQDEKNLFFCNNIFTWMERGNYTKLDNLIVSMLREKNENELSAAKINQKYQDDYLSGKYVSQERRDYSEKTASILKALSDELGFGIIDRMDYVCPDNECQIVSKNLGKHFFDMGHHTLSGARHFGQTLDNSRLIEELAGENFNYNN